jgi:hypothetical protein
MRRPEALIALLAVVLGTGCAASVGASTSKGFPTGPQALGPKAPCSSQPPPAGLLSCQDARQKGAPWLPSDVQAELAWYKHHEDSKPIEAWEFTRASVEYSSGGILAGSRRSCAGGEEGIVVGAQTGAFIVQGFTGSKPTPLSELRSDSLGLQPTAGLLQQPSFPRVQTALYATVA